MHEFKPIQLDASGPAGGELNPHSPNNVLTFGVTCAIQI